MNYKNDLFDLSARIGAHRSKVSQTHVKMLLEVGPNHGPKALRKLEANDPEPTWVSSDEFVGRISVLVKDGTSTKYFGSRSRLFCFQVEGRFRREWSGDDIEFGIWLHEPIARLPFGSSIAISFVKMIDPGLNVDLKSTTPHALSPLLCSMNVLRQDPSHPEILWDAPMPQEGESDRFEKAFDFPPWIHGQDAKEYTELGQDSYTSSEQRKKAFLKQDRRQAFRYLTDQIYTFQFFNPFLDLAALAIRLPVFQVGLSHYLGQQPLRFVCRSKSTGKEFFVIQVGH